MKVMVFVVVIKEALFCSILLQGGWVRDTSTGPIQGEQPPPCHRHQGQAGNTVQCGQVFRLSKRSWKGNILHKISKFFMLITNSN
jgi:hypothetical protein